VGLLRGIILGLKIMLIEHTCDACVVFWSKRVSPFTTLCRH